MTVHTIKTYDEHLIDLVVDRAPSNSDRKTAILTHGIFTDLHEKGRFDRLTDRLTKKGIDVVRFNFRGHGDSRAPSKEFTISTALSDYLSVLDWVRQQEPGEVSVIGSSFGGSIILLEQSLHTHLSAISRIVLLNPVVDYLKTFIAPTTEWGANIFSEERQYEILNSGVGEVQPGFIATRLFLLELMTLCPWNQSNAPGTPIKVFHGDLDDKVPLSFTVEHLSNLENVDLVVVEDAGHAFKSTAAENYVHNAVVDLFG